MREVTAVASRVRSRFRSWIKHSDSSISLDSDFMHQQHGSFFFVQGSSFHKDHKLWVQSCKIKSLTQTLLSFGTCQKREVTDHNCNKQDETDAAKSKVYNLCTGNAVTVQWIRMSLKDWCTKKSDPIFRCTTPSTGKRLGEVVVGTLYPVDGVVHRNIGSDFFVHLFVSLLVNKIL